MGISNEWFDDITQTVDGNFNDGEGETGDDDDLESDHEDAPEDAPNSNDNNLE